MWSWLFDSQRVRPPRSAVATADTSTRAQAGANALTELLGGTVLNLDASGEAVLEQAFGHQSDQPFANIVETGIVPAVHEDEREQFIIDWNDGVSSGQTFELSARLFCAEARDHRTCLLRATPLRMREGSPREWLVWLQDREEQAWIGRELSELVRRTRESSRADGLGMLAGGLAHQFNNLLHGIIGHADLMARRIDPSSPLHASLASIVGSSERAADICRHMLAYAGRGLLPSTACDVTQLVSDLRLELESICPPGCTLQLKLEPSLPHVKADPGQLRMALLNLVTNAAEASVNGPGTIRVRTAAQWLSADELRGCAAGTRMLPGSYIIVEVADDGVGIREDLLPHVFEPFVSSKFLGRGLGLAAVLGIARSLGGAVEVQSAQARGTRVKLLIPATGAANSNQRPEHAPASTLLLVQSDACLRELTRLALESAGHHVLLTTSAEEALSALENGGSHIDLLLLDESARCPRGELLDGLLDSHPRLPVVFMTDVTNAPPPRTGLPGLTVRRMLRKPWTIAELLATVASTLSEQRSLTRGGTDQSGTYPKLRQACANVS